MSISWAGVLWVAALLAAMLSLERLFLGDYEDGSFEVLALAPLPLSLIVGAKMLAHWLTTGLPLIVLSPVLAAMLHLPAAGEVLHFGADAHLDAVVECQTACCSEVTVHQALAPLEQRHPHACAPAIVAGTGLDEVEVDVAARRHRVADDLAPHPDLAGKGPLDGLADGGRQVRNRPRAVGLACRVSGRGPGAFDSAAHGSEAVTNLSASRPNYRW